jgi:hypothetical protein
VLGVYDPLAEDWRAIGGNRSLWEEWQPELRARRSEIGEITLERLRMEHERSPKWLRERSPFQPEEHERLGWSWPYTEESLVEFRAGAISIRMAVEFWRFLQDDETPTMDEEPDRDPYLFAVEVADSLQAFFDRGLEPFHPGLSVGWDGFPQPVALQRPAVIDSAPNRTEDPAEVFAHKRLYHICCLELYNHIVENATYHARQNETCGRTFVRQQGRAVHGQNRLRGVKYCSAHCARAQAQRQLRRRKRPSAP